MSTSGPGPPHRAQHQGLPTQDADRRSRNSRPQYGLRLLGNPKIPSRKPRRSARSSTNLIASISQLPRFPRRRCLEARTAGNLIQVTAQLPPVLPERRNPARASTTLQPLQSWFPEPEEKSQIEVAAPCIGLP